MGQLTIVNSFRMDNQFKFTCPIFGADVEMRQCMSLREMVWRGQGPRVRKGCQACMSASKCPIVHVVKECDPDRGIDPYFSKEPKLGKLSDKVLKTIAPLVVSDYIFRQSQFADMRDNERDMILNTNGLNGFKNYKGIDGASLEDVGYQKTNDHVPYKRAAPPKQPKIVSSVSVATPEPEAEHNLAAATGDMSAAINEAMKGEAA